MTATTTSASSPDAGRVEVLSGRLRSLDGLRGFALLGMLAWHAEVEWVRGGFARMTIFFVLAGFLAGRSLQRARAEGGAPFLTFWKRRARRLLPISVLGIGWAVLVTALVGGAHARERVTGDAAATLFSVANWRFIADEVPYAAIFEANSAFQHYWSLSLEEQAFLALPIVLGLAAWAGRAHRDLPVVLLGLLGLGCGLLPAVVSMAPDVAYYGTHVRFGEFLAGVVLAELLARVRHHGVAAGTARVVGGLGAVGLAVLVATMLLVDRSEAWLYEGGMVLFALPAVAVVAAAMLGRSAVTAVLGLPPLVAVGRWAFSIYVLHWPLYLLVAESPLDLRGTDLVLVQVGASIALGGVLHHLVERPLMAPRPARSSLRRRDLLVAGGAVAVLAASLFVPARQASVDFDRPALAAGAVGAAGSSDLPGIGLFGGSTAYTLTSGMPAWAEAHGSVRLTEGRPVVRCGIVTEGLRNERLRAGDPNFERPPEDCRWHDAWPAAVRSQAIDVAVIKASIWDLRTWILDGDGEERQIGDAVFDEHLAGLLADAVDRLTAAGATDVVLVTHLPPHPDLSTEEAADRAERNARYRRIAEEVARSHPAAHLADLTTWIESQPPEQIVQLAPVDRAHPDLEQSSIIWTEFLGPFIAEHTSSVAPTT